MDVDGRRTQVGVVSWGAGCAQEGTVGVYTSVGFFEFVDSTLRRRRRFRPRPGRLDAAPESSDAEPD